MNNNLLLTDDELAKLSGHLKQQVAEFVEGVGHEGERAAVLLSAARLDVALEKLLKKLMSPSSGGQDNLFDSDRPLGSFSAKITLAHRLNVIDNRVEHALQMVRKIRNSFAHSTTVSSLSNSPHNGQLNELIRDVKTNKDYFEAAAQALSLDPKFSPRLVDFCTAVMVLLLLLELVEMTSAQLQPAHTASLNAS